ncbi:MAG: hypothetical protein JW741_12865 [Sedimentisphaerales bacterium]|nr:hypothetical protein [Sedimentisphaerales bacterium]
MKATLCRMLIVTAMAWVIAVALVKPHLGEGPARFTQVFLGFLLGLFVDPIYEGQQSMLWRCFRFPGWSLRALISGFVVAFIIALAFMLFDAVAVDRYIAPLLATFIKALAALSVVGAMLLMTQNIRSDSFITSIMAIAILGVVIYNIPREAMILIVGTLVNFAWSQLVMRVIP